MEKNFKTIVGGRSEPFRNPDGFPRGIEILLKKAKVDPDFRLLLLRDPVAAAGSIELDISDSEERSLLSTYPQIIEKMVENTFVPKHHVSAFRNARSAAVLSLVLVSTVAAPAFGSGDPGPSMGITVEPPLATSRVFGQGNAVAGMLGRKVRP